MVLFFRGFRQITFQIAHALTSVTLAICGYNVENTTILVYAPLLTMFWILFTFTLFQIIWKIFWGTIRSFSNGNWAVNILQNVISKIIFYAFGVKIWHDGNNNRNGHNNHNHNKHHHKNGGGGGGQKNNQSYAGFQIQPAGNGNRSQSRNRFRPPQQDAQRDFQF